MKLPATDRAPNLSAAMVRDYPEALDNIEAVIRLARANFPRTNDVTIETAGSSPKASLTVSWTVLAFLVDAGRAALSLSGDKP
ncbi:hypothetical protein NKI61_29960 [Mesorhizobium sp. M0514]|uniref:hypothetical protein n=1 Tax=Mesorhizobium sp. M0514 TaxID=2956955 RepID=UPI0033362E3B